MRTPLTSIVPLILTLALGCAPKRGPVSPMAPSPAPRKHEGAQVVVRYLGHTCFLVTDDSGKAVMIDPFDESVRLAIPDERADVVLVTLDNRAHNNVGIVRDEPTQIITQEGETKAAGMTFRGVKARAWRSTEQKSRGETVMYAWEMAGMRFCHLGAPAVKLTEEQVAGIGPVDVLFAPVGGGPTLPPAEALHVIRQLNARAVLPMHYQTQATDPTISVDTLEPFLELIPPNWTVGQLKMNAIVLYPNEVLKEGSPPRILALTP